MPRWLLVTLCVLVFATLAWKLYTANRKEKQATDTQNNKMSELVNRLEEITNDLKKASDKVTSPTRVTVKEGHHGNPSKQ